jgi:hypothetical protein
MIGVRIEDLVNGMIEVTVTTSLIEVIGATDSIGAIAAIGVIEEAIGAIDFGVPMCEQGSMTASAKPTLGRSTRHGEILTNRPRTAGMKVTTSMGSILSGLHSAWVAERSRNC